MRSSREHKPVLLWSPHSPDLFALGTTDKLSLFEFQRPPLTGDIVDLDGFGAADEVGLGSLGLDSLAPPRTPQSIRAVSAVTDVSQLTCATWCPRPEQPWTLAVGTATGKVVLHDCTPSASRTAAATSAVREFFPRQQRQCFSIAWNPVFTQLIAAGLDRDRRDYGVLVWDVERDTSSFAAEVPSAGASGGVGASGSSAALRSVRGSLPGSLGAATAASQRVSESSHCVGFDISSAGFVDAVSSAHAYAPLANSEAAVAVSWLPESPHSLLVGTSFRWLRLFDVRARDERLACHAHAKAVYGVVFDPFDPNRLLTFSDASDTPAGLVKGWDLRKLHHNTPLFTLAAGDVAGSEARGGTAPARPAPSRGLLQVGWCPTQRGLVGTMAEGATGLCIWDVDQMLLIRQHQQQGGATPQPDPKQPQSHAGAPPAPPPAPASLPALQLPTQVSPRQQQRAAVSGPAAAEAAAAGSARPSEVLELSSSDAPHCLQSYECDAPLTTFSWHTSHHSRLLVLLRKGTQDSVLRELRLSSPAALSWSPHGHLLVATPKRLVVFCADQPQPPQTFAAPDAAADVLDAAAGATAAEWRGRPLGFRFLSAPADGLEEGAGLAAAPDAPCHAADVLSAMRWRAEADYGLSTGATLALLQSAAAAPSTAERRGLFEAWRWVHVAKGLPASSEALRGHVAMLEGSSPATEVQCTSSSLVARESAARSAILRTCGWALRKETEALDEALASLEASLQFERAALLAVFHAGAHPEHRPLQRAVTALEQGGAHAAVDAERATVLRMTAMVIAGFDPRSALWAATVRSTARRVRSSHLRLLLAALCSCCEEAAAEDTQAEGYEGQPRLDVQHELLEEVMRQRLSLGADSPGGLPCVGAADEALLTDAVALACRFLSDEQLHALFRRLEHAAAAGGSLAGLCFGGLTEAALPLLQAHVDRTCDVQTAAALLLWAPQEVLGLPLAARWLERYRELLNKWQLYHARCRLDGALGKARAKADGGGARAGASAGAGWGAPASQVFARCAFCNSSLQTGGVAKGAQAKGRAATAPPQASRAGRANACPSCKKALPRCSLCLQHLGCPNPADLPDLSSFGAIHADADADFTPSPSSAFSHWMVWCQTCRHGGHARHLEDWFELHDVCPVADCDCRCSLLDFGGAEHKDAADAA